MEGVERRRLSRPSPGLGPGRRAGINSQRLCGIAETPLVDPGSSFGRPGQGQAPRSPRHPPFAPGARRHVDRSRGDGLRRFRVSVATGDPTAGFHPLPSLSRRRSGPRAASLGVSWPWAAVGVYPELASGPRPDAGAAGSPIKFGMTLEGVERHRLSRPSPGLGPGRRAGINNQRLCGIAETPSVEPGSSFGRPGQGQAPRNPRHRPFAPGARRSADRRGGSRLRGADRGVEG